MKDNEILALALNSVRHRNLRSWLAILGIVIGVASVVIFISISMGMNAQVEENLGGLGGNLISISAGGARAGSMFAFGGGGPPGGGAGVMAQTSDTDELTFRQAEKIWEVEGVKAVDARLSERVDVTYKDKKSSMSVVGTDPDVFEQTIGTELESGRMLEPADRGAVVLGNSVQERVFDGEDMLGRQIKIDGQSFKVVGILKSAGMSVTNPDNSLFISIDMAKDLFDEKKVVNSIVVAADENYEPQDVADSIEIELRDIRRVSEKEQDFTVTTASSITSTISSITDTLGMLLVGIASI